MSEPDRSRLPPDLELEPFELPRETDFDPDLLEPLLDLESLSDCPELLPGFVLELEDLDPEFDASGSGVIVGVKGCGCGAYGSQSHGRTPSSHFAPDTSV